MRIKVTKMSKLSWEIKSENYRSMGTKTKREKKKREKKEAPPKIQT